MHTGYFSGTTRIRLSHPVAGLVIPMRTIYRGFTIVLSIGSILIQKGDEEFSARLPMDEVGLMEWAKRKVDRLIKF